MVCPVAQPLCQKHRLPPCPAAGLGTDVGDAAIDSAVYLRAGSLQISSTEIFVDVVASKPRARTWDW